MAGLFEQGGLLGAIAPNVTGMINPLSMMGAAMYSGNPAAVLGQVGTMQLQAQQLNLNQLAQLRQAQQMRQQQEQWQAEQALAAQRIAETQRHNVAMEARPSSQLQLLDAYRNADPETQAAMQKLFSAGTTINMPTSGEAETYSQTEDLIGNLSQLDQLLSKEDVDLSDFAGIWSEVKSQPTITGAALRAITGDLSKDQERAVRLAKMVETQITKRLSRGDISDAERESLQAALGLIGGADTNQAIKDLLAQQQTMYQRQRGLRGQLGQTTPSAGAPGGAAGGFKVLSREPAQ